MRLFLPLLFLALTAFSPLDDVRALLDAGKSNEAFAVSKKASDAGDAEGHEALAWFYDEGKVVARDQAAAARLFRMAAQAGRKHSQWRLGVMLDTGQGVSENAEEAFASLAKAAAQDYPPAFVSMGVMTATGRGTPVDYAGARAWYEKAARHGEPHGFYGIAVLFANGQGVKRDMVEALAWMMVSASLGDEAAEDRLKAYDASPKQVARATKRANAIAREYGHPNIGLGDVKAPKRS
jgi:TPR repeat protein